jgi:hypothetical protein
MFDDAPFCFLNRCKSWSAINETQFIEMILHPIPKHYALLPIPDY